MRTRPLFCLVVSFLAGLLFGVAGQIRFLWIGMGLMLVPFLSYYKEKDFRRWIASCLLIGIFFALGGFRMYGAIGFRERSLAAYDPSKEVLVQGQLYHKEEGKGQYLYYLKNCFYSSSGKQIPCNGIIAYQDTDLQSIGQILVLKGKLNQFEEARNEGGFDLLRYYSSRGIDFYMKDYQLKESHGKGNEFLEALYNFRRRLRSIYEENMNVEDAGVLSTMVLGDRSILDTGVKSLYQSIGISHILSISGLHVSMLGLSLYHLLRRLGARYKGSACIAMFVILWYGLFTGAGLATRRAIIMLGLGMLADCMGRVTDLLTSLALTAFVLLVDQPFFLFYSGFIFSFGAVFGAGVVGRILIQYAGNCHGVSKSIGTILTNTGIWSTTMLLLAYYYYELPGYGFLCNLILLPSAGFILFAGAVGGVLSLSKMCLFNWMGGILLKFCHLGLGINLKVGRFFQGMPYCGLITGKPTPVRAGIYLLLLFWGSFYFYRSTSEENRECYRKYLKILLWFSMLCILLLLPQRKSSEIVTLDVGQGDGIYIGTTRGYHLMIDGGSSSEKHLGERRLLPFLKYKGIRNIDYWFVSHLDSDHVSALEELMEMSYPIDAIVLPYYIPRDETYEEFLAKAGAAGIEVIYGRKGDCFDFGNEKIWILADGGELMKENTISTLSKADVIDKNGFSMALLYENRKQKDSQPWTGVFAGDLTEEGEKIMNMPKIEKGYVDLFKVNHHGSRNSNCEEFLNKINPKYGVISCAKNNGYGHPAPEVLDRLKGKNTILYLTMEQGEIRFLFKRGEFKIETSQDMQGLWGMVQYGHENNR